MLKDKIILGAIIGILADAVKLTSNYIMFKLGWTNVVFWQIVAAKFLNKEDLFKPIAIFIGGVSDLTVTAILGVGFVYFIYLFGQKFLFIKGIGYGMSVWVILLGIILGQTVAPKLSPTPSGVIVTMIAHLIFGLSLALFAKVFIKYVESEDQAIEKLKAFKINLPFIPQPVSKPAVYRIKEKEELPKSPKKIKPKKL